MGNRSEPNAQNSEIDAKLHPSGDRIEQLMKKRALGEEMRRSERQGRLPSDNNGPVEEQDSNAPISPHRQTPDNRSVP